MQAFHIFFYCYVKTAFSLTLCYVYRCLFYFF